ncbi:MAG: hypothetical protein ABSA93_25695 [Streptosporangiaceae bacterium]|jgi:hypothetical protein
MHESEPETPAALPAGSINYERLYAYRFRDIDQAGRQAVWQEIASFPGPRRALLMVVVRTVQVLLA